MLIFFDNPTPRWLILPFQPCHFAILFTDPRTLDKLQLPLDKKCRGDRRNFYLTMNFILEIFVFYRFSEVYPVCEKQYFEITYTLLKLLQSAKSIRMRDILKYLQLLQTLFLKIQRFQNTSVIMERKAIEKANYVLVWEFEPQLNLVCCWIIWNQLVFAIFICKGYYLYFAPYSQEYETKIFLSVGLFRCFLTQCLLIVFTLKRCWFIFLNVKFNVD